MLDVALKEWSIVCDLLVEGRFAILLRKGGIHEYHGPGRFELEHQRFGLFPAWVHQDPQRIKPPYRDAVQVFDREPTDVTIRGYAEVSSDCIWQLPTTGSACRDLIESLDDLHPWTRPQIDMRLNYKPQRPLYLLALRVYRLSSPPTIPNRDAYAGCKSWVPLDEADDFDERDAMPAMSDETFAQLTDRLRRSLHLASPVGASLPSHHQVAQMQTKAADADVQVTDSEQQQKRQGGPHRPGRD